MDEVNLVEQEATKRNDLTKVIISNMKKQAKRLLTLLAKYNSQKHSDGILNKIAGEINYQDIEQYCDLISKQFCGKIEQLNEKITRIKLDIAKVTNQIKARPESNVADRVAKFKERIEEFQNELQQVWKQQHFLTLNYRIDIAAKELQRWTAVINANQLNSDKIKENIDAIFA